MRQGKRSYPSTIKREGGSGIKGMSGKGRKEREGRGVKGDVRLPETEVAGLQIKYTKFLFIIPEMRDSDAKLEIRVFE